MQNKVGNKSELEQNHSGCCVKKTVGKQSKADQLGFQGNNSGERRMVTVGVVRSGWSLDAFWKQS